MHTKPTRAERTKGVRTGWFSRPSPMTPTAPTTAVTRTRLVDVLSAQPAGHHGWSPTMRYPTQCVLPRSDSDHPAMPVVLRALSTKS